MNHYCAVLEFGLVLFGGSTFLLMVSLLSVPSLRQKLLIPRILKVIKATLPKISDTEAAALEAGTPWWDADLFQGNPDWTKLHEAQWAQLSVEEQAFLNGPVNHFCAMINDWEVTHKLKNIPDEAWAFLKEQGFFGLVLPKKYGGKGFSPYAVLRIVAKIASRSGTAAVIVMVPNSLGPGELIHRYGTQAQKDHYLSRLAQGLEVPCFGLTSAVAGSDAASLIDSGVVCYGSYGDQEHVLGVRLNWNKRYITLAPVATLLGLAFKIEDPDGLLNRVVDQEITLAIVPTSTPGVEIGHRALPLNAPFPNGPTRGVDVFLPLDFIIGGEQGIAQGWRMLMECLAAGRGISLPALCVGSGKLVARSVGAYARIRQQFNLPIGKFEGVEEALAQVAGLTYLMDAASALNAAALKSGYKSSVLSAILKYHLTEMMRKVVNLGMDVVGGKGIIMGPQNLLGTPYMTIPIAVTVEGANILTRSLIIYGQGSVRCHPYLLSEVQAALQFDVQKPDAELLAAFDETLMRHVRYSIANLARCVAANTFNLPIFVAPPKVHPSLRRYYVSFSKLSSVLALMSEVSLVLLGGSIKRQEKLSARLGDVLSYLYLGSAVLRRFEESGAEEELPFVEWGCQESLYRIGQAVEGFLQNFPNQAIAQALRGLIFPFGKRLNPPSDRLGSQLAQAILKTGSVREQLTNGMFIPPELDQPVALLDHTLAVLEALEPTEQKIRQALKSGMLAGAAIEERILEAVRLGVITSSEAALMQEAEVWRARCIQVDEFSQFSQAEYGTLATPQIDS